MIKLSFTLPPAPATILDVGGAAGAYAFPLAEPTFRGIVKKDLATGEHGNSKKVKDHIFIEL